MLVGNESHTGTKQVVSAGVAFVHKYMHTFIQKCTCVYVYMSTWVCKYIYVCVLYIHIKNIHTHTHTHIHRPNSQCKPICLSLMESRELIMMVNIHKKKISERKPGKISL